MTRTASLTEPLAAIATAQTGVAQTDPSVTVEGTLGWVFMASVVLAVLLGLATAGLAVYRYRNRPDPALRGLVVGLVLITVAPLPFRIFVAGTIPAAVRTAVPPIVQTLGLLAVLWAMYGDPRATDGRLLHLPTGSDLIVVGAALTLAALTVVAGDLWESHVAVLVGLPSVVALSTFVAGQAARAAYRYRSPAMASLSIGILFLAALPSPLGAVLVEGGSAPNAVVVAVVSGAILIGEAAMLLTLVYR